MVKIGETNAAIKASENGREDTVGLSISLFWSSRPLSQPERRKLLSTLDDVQTQNKALKEELDAFGAADPAKHGKKLKAVEVCKEAAVRWTGERPRYGSLFIFSLRSSSFLSRPCPSHFCELILVQTTP